MPSQSVTQLTRKIRSLLEVQVGEVHVEGEVSNHRRQQSGHHYFTLKDPGAQISCVLFRGNASRIGRRLQLQDGQAITVKGEISVYEPRGNYQIIVKNIQASGQGQLQAQFEALKQQLKAEGLFDPQHKQPIPRHPRHIGVITSPSGAALQDFLQVTQRRAPYLHIHLLGVPVQGEHAHHHIIQAIQQLNQQSATTLPPLDAIILTRGGGSLEDLWCFNQESLARAIHASALPILSAIGHETDFTIADFVADQREPTPSAAAERIAPDRQQLLDQLRVLQQRLKNPLNQTLSHARQLLQSQQKGGLQRLSQRQLQRHSQQLDQNQSQLQQHSKIQLQQHQTKLQHLSQRHQHQHPRAQLSRQQQSLQKLHTQLQRASQRQLQQKTTQLQQLQHQLHTLSPDQTLQRGFTLTHAADGSLIRHPDQAPPGTPLHTQTSQGTIHSQATEPPKTPKTPKPSATK